MGTMGKQGLTTPPRPRAGNGERAAEEASAPVNVTALRNDTLAASKAFIRHTVEEKRSYLKAAFANVYNLSLLGGALAASALTLNPLLAIAAIGAEALWLLYAPDSKRLRSALWDPRFDAEQRQRLEQERAALLSHLDEGDRLRVEALIAHHRDINRLAAENPSFTGDLLRTEIGKTDRLVQAFIDMTVTCARYEDYLRSVNVGEMGNERRRWEAAVESEAQNEAAARIAEKNLAIIERRFDKIKEIRQYLTLARGQLSLIENSFKLIADQIVTMQSPRELTGQLNELLDGVESIKQTAAETERLIDPPGL